MAFADKSGVVSYYSTASEIGGYYHTHFTTVEVVTTDKECSLKFTTYKNTCDRETAEITDTEIIDTYKMIKTK